MPYLSVQGSSSNFPLHNSLKVPRKAAHKISTAKYAVWVLCDGGGDLHCPGRWLSECLCSSRCRISVSRAHSAIALYTTVSKYLGRLHTKYQQLNMLFGCSVMVVLICTALAGGCQSACVAPGAVSQCPGLILQFPSTQQFESTWEGCKQITNRWRCCLGALGWWW